MKQTKTGFRVTKIQWMTWALLLLSLFCLFMRFLPGRRLVLDGGMAFSEGEAVSEAVVYEGISLKPGVYTVCLEYETDRDLQGFCTVKDGSVITGGLLVNFEHFYSGLGRTGFEVWLFEKADDLQVTVNYSGAGRLSTGRLTIVDTRRLWTMLLTVSLFVCGILRAVARFVEKNRRGMVSREKKEILFFLGAIAFFSSVPYLYGHTIAGGDLTYHLQRIEGVKDGILSGQFPVRLEPRWVYDHGYANGIFYCNVFLLLPALLRIAGFPVCFCYNTYCVALNLATVWVSYHCFSKILQDKRIGCLCSGCYTLCIYRIDRFILVSSTGEGTALLFLPLVLYGFYRILAQDAEGEGTKGAWIPAAAGLTGLIHSHVLSCEMTAFVILLYLLLYCRRIFVPRTFLNLAKAALLSLLLSLWFLLPFLDYYVTQELHIKNVSARTIQNRGILPGHLLLLLFKNGSNDPMAGMGLYDTRSLGIGLTLFLGVLPFFAAWFLGRLRERDALTVFVKKTAVIGLIMTLMTWNGFPWDRIQKLHPLAAALVSSLQFPTRFLGWATLCLILVMGYSIKDCFERGRKGIGLAILSLAIFGLATSSLGLMDHAKASDSHLALYDNAGMGYGYISGAEYLIEGTDQEALTFSGPVAGEGVEIMSYRKKPLGGTLLCRNGNDAESFVDLPLLLYKGYQAHDAETGEPMALRYGANREVRVLLPADYEGEIEVSFVSPLYWRLGEAVSLLTAAGLFLWRFAGRRKDAKKE